MITYIQEQVVAITLSNGNQYGIIMKFTNKIIQQFVKSSHSLLFT